MKVKRAALLGLLVCLSGASASAQIAPGNQGDIGLFTMPTADTPRAGMLTFGVYGWKEQLVAGNLAFSDTDTRLRLYSHWAGEASIGIGLTDKWTMFASAGEEKFQSRGGWRGGALNSVQIFGRFDADEPRKIRIGTKYKFVSESSAAFVTSGLFRRESTVGFDDNRLAFKLSGVQQRPELRERDSLIPEINGRSCAAGNADDLLVSLRTKRKTRERQSKRKCPAAK